MERRFNKTIDGVEEFVCNENGKVVFFRKKVRHKGVGQRGGNMESVSGYGRITDYDIDIGTFTHLPSSLIPEEAVVEFQYIDGNPDNDFSDAKFGTLRIYDRTGKLIIGENFAPDRVSKISATDNGNILTDENYPTLLVPELVKNVVGKDYGAVVTQGQEGWEPED